ncbi:MAG TPA: hypothetical protein VGC89_15400 [Pyrinomonadaceae bacterium]|jgi:hypothetical protein
MTAKISERLSQKLKEAGAQESPEELSVIVNIKAGSNLDALKKQGLKITHAYENIPYVAGTLPASGVETLARLDEVQEIDYDAQDVEPLRKQEDD